MNNTQSELLALIKSGKVSEKGLKSALELMKNDITPETAKQRFLNNKKELMDLGTKNKELKNKIRFYNKQIDLYAKEKKKNNIQDNIDGNLFGLMYKSIQDLNKNSQRIGYLLKEKEHLGMEYKQEFLANKVKK